MTYNTNDGSCCGGWGFGGFGADALILLLFFGLFGGGMWGGMGGWGGFGGGAGMLGTTSLAATETASLISQQNTADRVSAIAADTRQILGQTGGIIEAVNTVGNRAQDGFARVDSSLCQLGNNIAMQAVNNHNNITSQLTEMRFGIQQSFCDLKGETMQAMNTNTAAIMARIDCLEKNAMQDKLAAANEKIATLKAERDNSQQTQTLLAAISAQRGCSPCSPCCQPSPCDQLSAAIIAKGIDGIVNPSTTTPTT